MIHLGGNRYAIIFETSSELHRCLEVIAEDPDVVVERANNRLSRHYNANLTAGYRFHSPHVLFYQRMSRNVGVHINLGLLVYPGNSASILISEPRSYIRPQ